MYSQGLVVLCFSILVLVQCTHKSTPHQHRPDTLQLGFYNVENLFDTLDNPERDDNWYLPESELQWNSAKYKHKLSQLARVLDAAGPFHVLGLCEIENEQVVKELLKATSSMGDYDIIHFESPDKRGIDVALCYDPDLLKRSATSYLELFFPEDIEPDYTSRYVLSSTLRLGKEDFVFYVNHWPSRRDGPRISNARRAIVAAALKRDISKSRDLRKEYVVVMGDFNDEPRDSSVSIHLGAIPLGDDTEIIKTDLINVFDSVYVAGAGTYNYRGDWMVLDHMSLSGNLFDSQNWEFVNATIFKENWMCYQDKNSGEWRPSRTHAGKRYFSGFSDHLPIKVTLRKKEK